MDDEVDPRGATLAAVTRAAAGATMTETGVRRAAIAADGAGRQLAHFVVEKALGAGGMGEVYLATDLALDRRVALKVLPRDLSSRADFRTRFAREARTQAGLNHPNICHIYFIGEDAGQLFFAMEYVDGETLEARLRRLGKLTPAEAIELVRQAALGLREAQQHAFTHRDVKPSNLIVDGRGVVKVLDFGLTAAEGEEGSGGTPLYMAPEQARRESSDFRADVYALGATLHHLLTGAPPFTGNSAAELAAQHGDAPRPRLASAQLDELCARMMAKLPADRFASYDELLDALDRLAPSVNRPAGFWARSFAFAADFFVVALLALPFQFLRSLALPALVVAAMLYPMIGHGVWGRTLGKLALELEVIPSDRGGRVGLLRAAIRWLVQLGPSFLLVGVVTIIDHSDLDPTLVKILDPLMILVGLATPFIMGASSAFAANKRAPWDRASHTQVRYQRRS